MEVRIESKNEIVIFSERKNKKDEVNGCYTELKKNRIVWHIVTEVWHWDKDIEKDFSSFLILFCMMGLMAMVISLINGEDIGIVKKCIAFGLPMLISGIEYLMNVFEIRSGRKGGLYIAVGKVLNAYEKEQKFPTNKQIREASPIYFKSNEISEYFSFILFNIVYLIAMCAIYGHLGTVATVIFSTILLLILKIISVRKWAMKIAAKGQWLVYQKPMRIDITIATKALWNYLEMEEHFLRESEENKVQ